MSRVAGRLGGPGLAVLLGCLAGIGEIAPAAMGQAPATGLPSSAPPTPTPGPPSTVTGGAPLSVEERLRQLEGMFQATRESHAQREAALEARIRQLEGSSRAATASPANSSSTGSSSRGVGTAAGTMTGVPPGSSTSSSAAGFGERELTQGGSAGLSPLATTPSDMPAKPLDLKGSVKFGPGFQIATEDDEYVFQFHNLTQIDGRFYEQGGQSDTRDTFGVPRQWFIFSGRLKKPYEYYLAINEGFDNLNLLDAYLNVHYWDALQFRIGRYKTPFTYEFYALPVNSLITPERSQFFNNFGLNRDVGMMLWGQVFEKKLDYAVGIFNGNRNGFIDLDNGKDVAAFVNFNPFLGSGMPALEHLNFGGSLDAGQEFAPQIPNRLRLNVPTVASAAIGVPFLIFNPGVLDSGSRAFWSLHAAWYYKSLSLIAEWQSGYQQMAFNSAPSDRTKVGVQSYYVQAGYFLTGEQVTMRGQLKPKHDFDLRPGKFGLGAWELAARYNALDVSDAVFTAGFANPQNWSRTVSSIDLGVNWYWTQSIKTFMGWQHNVFGTPVLFDSDPVARRMLTDDLFWFRFQISF